MKIIRVLPGGRTSLQTHENRDELWYVVAGEGTVNIGPQQHLAKPGAQFFVKRTVPHRICGVGPVGVTLLEVSFGEFDEKDIKRYEDDYART